MDYPDERQDCKEVEIPKTRALTLLESIDIQLKKAGDEVVRLKRLKTLLTAHPAVEVQEILDLMDRRKY